MGKYNESEYNNLSTSPEILSTIESIAGDSVLDLQSQAYRLWSRPSPIEDRQIVELARKLTDQDLYWGGYKIKN
jgi:hypothetical protein